MRKQTDRGLRLPAVLALALACAGGVTSAGAASSSAHYQIERSAIASGGHSQSSHFQLTSAIDQDSPTGPGLSAHYTLYAGFISVPDRDADGVPDNTDNCPTAANANQLDTDGDDLGDACDLDDDGDGISDTDELSLNTNPLLADTDGDGLDDGVETGMDGNPADYQPGVDTDPRNPDTDGDGLPDGSDPDPLLSPDGDLAPRGAPDGVIDGGDVLVALRIALGLVAATPLDLAHGDVYPPGAPDGVINLQDLLLIRQLGGP